ncbi:sigma-70 family RNA polymerase sigma factor [Alkalibacterium sp. f15]|uniref:sigma-70 family RNA polymerase sigma factor n=1 Tax=Alkalibacterium sp. f15 TaxID=3414029 RepID=UPI003BF90DC7
MIRQLTEEVASDFFFIHDSLVYGVLKACHVSYNHPDYEDYLQVGRLKLVEAYENYPNDLNEEEAYYRFTGFAYQRVRWGILDELRKAAKQRERESALPDDSILENQLMGYTSDDDVLFLGLFQSMLVCLTEQEQAYLIDAVMLELSVQDIARKYGVSRNTVYQWKHKIGEKLIHFKNDLKK